jgi:hypothetical protein
VAVLGDPALVGDPALAEFARAARLVSARYPQFDRLPPVILGLKRPVLRGLVAMGWRPHGGRRRFPSGDRTQFPGLPICGPE